MRNMLHRIGKFYSRVMMNIIGIFIFVGILSILFGEQGWIPNEDIYAISRFVYLYVIPIIVAYIAAIQIKGTEKSERINDFHAGGAIAVMAVAGLLVANDRIGIFGAVILGPCCGFLWKRVLESLIKKANTRIEMLVRNLVVAAVGTLLVMVSFFVLTPIFSVGNQLLMQGISFLIEKRAIFLLSFLMEPAKVLFLNNSIHYGILLPLGMEQMAEEGKSILFLLETNPGPGFGVLLASFFQNRNHSKKEENVETQRMRKEYTTAMFVEMIGGIHEVYFPEILSNLWLLIALIAGGTVGNLCFLLMDVGAVTAISPGSIITFLPACMKKGMVGAATGIFLSALTSFAVASYILYKQNKEKKAPEMEKIKAENSMVEMKNVTKIGFVCDAGVGSSSMGAALLRRKLKELQLDNIEVAAYASDQVPEDLDLIICQRNFKELLLPEIKNVVFYTMESLVSQTEIADIASKLQQGRDAGV